jgi:hypothetical protein
MLLALRVYHSDMPVREADGPGDVLRAFVDTYGVPIYVGEELGMFFSGEFLDKAYLESLTVGPLGPGVRLASPPTTTVPVMNTGRIIRDDVGNATGTMVLLAFAFDLDAYHRDLLAHGFVPRS